MCLGFAWVVGLALLQPVSTPAERPPAQQPTRLEPEPPPAQPAQAQPRAPSGPTEAPTPPEPAPSAEPAIAPSDSADRDASVGSVAPLSPDAHPPADPVPTRQDFSWTERYVRVVPPRRKGTVLLSFAAVSYGVAATIQFIDAAAFENSGTGVAERILLGNAIILAPIGMHFRARHAAYFDTALGRRQRRTTGLIAGGFVLAGLGLAGGLANEVFWWRCQLGEQGPYVDHERADDDDLFGPQCKYGLPRAALDLSAAAVGAGLSMVTWALKYRADMRIYRHAKIVLAPTLGPGRVGISVGGRL